MCYLRHGVIVPWARCAQDGGDAIARWPQILRFAQDDMVGGIWLFGVQAIVSWE